ncbi:carboxypeptidase-like regulatory domain-containing protein [Niabella hibiscisoli]|uniref:carboxypeptidase-like regulatory domain-containing protein n=1 Tax=Niabella hibiscisoli TaxID=1825928 RepID=UPI001F0D97F5|nr:carboxypeptidase-like regulatory domain-containing protein [Niabella hibiscisoli]MCH5719217.1 carboxypeptidase-like regulatory domain-containing protein [Niabella hibiscisoli]
MRYLLLLVTFLGVSPLYAQNKKIITGIVRDTSRTLLIGVTVQLKNSPIVTITDSTGHFSIESQNPDKDVLQFSSIGYQSIEQKVDANTEMQVFMLQETKSGDEVVVVAFGTQKNLRWWAQLPVSVLRK